MGDGGEESCKKKKTVQPMLILLFMTLNCTIKILYDSCET